MFVIWGGEFCRTLTSDGNANGATDEIGLRAIQDPVYDLHYPFLRRDFRLTDVHGTTALTTMFR